MRNSSERNKFRPRPLSKLRNPKYVRVEVPRRLSWYKYQCRPQVREGGSAEVSVLVQVPVQVPRTSEESTNYFRHRVAKCGTEQVPSPAPLARSAVNERGRSEWKVVRPGTQSPPEKNSVGRYRFRTPLSSVPPARTRGLKCQGVSPGTSTSADPSHLRRVSQLLQAQSCEVRN